MHKPSASLKAVLSSSLFSAAAYGKERIREEIMRARSGRKEEKKESDERNWSVTVD